MSNQPFNFMYMSGDTSSTIFPPTSPLFQIFNQLFSPLEMNSLNDQMNPFGVPSMNFMFGNGMDSGFNGNSSGFHDFLDQIFRQYQPKATPPTSKLIIEGLPQIKIDQTMVDEKTECAVCKDQFELDEMSLKLPCEHLYHPDCIKPWLEQHNTCPVCRYELPTDDQEYESKRKQKMANRNVHEEEIWERVQTIQRDYILNETLTELQKGNSKSNNSSSSIYNGQPPLPIDEALQISYTTSSPTQSGNTHECEYGKINLEDCILLNPGEDLFDTLPCGHSFHHSCLLSCIQHSGQDTLSSFFTCPKCNQKATILQPTQID